MPQSKPPSQPRKGKRFRRAATAVQADIRRVSEGRGFAVSRVLTAWDEIAGAEIAAIAKPVDVRHGRGFGATLTVLTTGAHAPILEMKKEALRERVNQTYGYTAISRIRITQTAPEGFAEGQTPFSPTPKRAAPAPDPALAAKATKATADVADPELRRALSALGENVLKPRTT
ncbi:MAG: DciA family protein [Pseudomonadota bacterium]